MRGEPQRVLARQPLGEASVAAFERAGYPGVAADLDTDKIASVLPAMKKRALEMWAEGERLTGHPGLPLEMTPNLTAAE